MACEYEFGKMAEIGSSIIATVIIHTVIGDLAVMTLMTLHPISPVHPRVTPIIGTSVISVINGGFLRFSVLRWPWHSWWAFAVPPGRYMPVGKQEARTFYQADKK